MASKETNKAPKKAKTAKSAPVKENNAGAAPEVKEVKKEDIVIEASVEDIIPEEPKKVEEQVEESEPIQKMMDIMSTFEEEKQNLDEIIKKQDPKEAEANIKAEIEKMESLKKEVEKTIKNKYTSLWSGIDYNL